MIKFFKAGYLKSIPRQPSATEILRYPSAHKNKELLWNNTLDSHYVLKIPLISEIETIVRTVQRQLLRGIWEESIVSVSDDGRRARGFVFESTSRLKLDWLEMQPAQTPFDQAQDWPLKRQQKYLRSISPHTLEDALEKATQDWMWNYGRTPAIAPTQNDIVDPEEWLERFFGIFAQKDSRTGLIFLLCTLFQLKERGFVLAPQRAITLFSLGVGQYLKRHPEQRTNPDGLGIHLGRVAKIFFEYRNVLGEGFRYDLSPQGFLVGHPSDPIGLRTHDLLLSTNYSSPKEISWEFCDGFKRPIPSRFELYIGSSATLTNFLTLCAEKNQGYRVFEHVDPFIPRLLATAGVTDDLPLWTKGLKDFRASIKGIKYIGTHGRHIGLFLQWIKLNNGTLRDPRALTKAYLVNDSDQTAKTFMKFVEAMDIDTRHKNHILAKVYSFLTWIWDSNNIKAACARDDLKLSESRFERSRNKTPRKRLKSYVLDEIGDLLVEKKIRVYKWSAWAQKTKELIRGEYIFCPILPAIIYLLLRWPLRGNQVRYLDGGEFDAMRYNFETRVFERNPLGSAKRKAIGEPEREMGVFVPAQSEGAFSDAHNLDLQVALNKRRVGERAEYTIPYVDDETYWVIEQVIAWQAKYGLEPILVQEHTDPQAFQISQDLPTVTKFPWISCLFRDPRKRSGHPPGPNRVGLFWDRLCVEYDRRNQTWQNPSTGEIGPRPGWPKMSTSTTVLHKQRTRRRDRSVSYVEKERIYYHAIHDIHSLRVAGVSYLLDRGLPLAVVASIAGHGSLQMTLHYYVPDGQFVRKKLSEIIIERPDFNLQAAEIQRRINDAKNHKDWLLGSTEIAFTALQQAVNQGGTWRLSPTGICPGTSCSNGLKLKTVFRKGEDDRTLVPGSLCGLCAFRIYGPPFLPGLVKEFNETLYALEKIISRQKELRFMRMQAESDGRLDHAIVLRDEDEQLSIQCEPDCAHLARLYEMINECLAFSAKQDSSGKSQGRFLAIQSLKPMGVEISPVGQFEQMVEILKTDVLIPGTKSIVSSEVNDRFQLKLLNMIAKNGVGPFLAGLPSTVARDAALEFAELLQRSIPNRTDIENVFVGRSLLSEVGFGAKQKVQNGISLLSQKFDPTAKKLAEPF